MTWPVENSSFHATPLARLSDSSVSELSSAVLRCAPGARLTRPDVWRSGPGGTTLRWLLRCKADPQNRSALCAGENVGVITSQIKGTKRANRFPQQLLFINPLLFSDHWANASVSVFIYYVKKSNKVDTAVTPLGTWEHRAAERRRDFFRDLHDRGVEGWAPPTKSHDRHRHAVTREDGLPEDTYSFSSQTSFRPQHLCVLPCLQWGFWSGGVPETSPSSVAVILCHKRIVCLQRWQRVCGAPGARPDRQLVPVAAASLSLPVTTSRDLRSSEPGSAWNRKEPLERKDGGQFLCVSSACKSLQVLWPTEGN